MKKIKKGYFRFPALHGTSVVFTGEGDLWRCSVEGGDAQRLTSHHGSETHPRISPDGKWIAFTGKYEGFPEVFVVPLCGGRPKRLTYNIDASFVVNWTRDGRILYRSTKNTTLPDVRLFLIDPVSLQEEPVPLNQASEGVYDDAGRILYFTRLPFQGSHTKNYKGGSVEQIWKFDGKKEAEPLTEDYPGTSKNPMYYNKRLYFLSDRNGGLNLWSMNESGKDLKQHTFHAAFEVRSADHYKGQILYQCAGDLYLYDIEQDNEKKLEISLISDFDQTREKWIENPSDYIEDYDLSPDGRSLLLTARGRIFYASAGKGRLFQVSQKEGVRYKHAVFVKNSGSCLALSDEKDEFEFSRILFGKSQKETRITGKSKTINLKGYPSPDGSVMLYGDKDRRVWLADLKTDEQKEIVRSDYEEVTVFAWSPDSSFAAFTMTAASNLMTQIFLYDRKKNEIFPVTSERYHSFSPAWSPDGKWLYFLSDRHLNTVVPSPWGPRQPEPYFKNPDKVYMLDLTGGQRSPFLENDELQPAEKKKKEKDDAASLHMVIKRKGLNERLWEVPVRPGLFSDLQVTDDRLFIMEMVMDEEMSFTLNMTKIQNEKPAEMITLCDKCNGFLLSADKKKILLKKNSHFYVFDSTLDKIDQWDDIKVDLSSWRFSVNPVSEWAQMLKDAWRMERDYFYDKELHGADYEHLLRLHLPLVEKVTDREELDDLIAMLVSELRALHTFVRGGDIREGREKINIGCLGAEFREEEGHWFIGHIYKTDPDLPGKCSPLLRPDLDIREGDELIAFDGIEVKGEQSPHRLLRGKVRCQIILAMKRQGKLYHAVVKTLSPEDEVSMRYAEWEYLKRLAVEKESGGSIGYLHLRAMGRDDYNEWARQFYPVFDRKGLIIDVRHNRGGNIDSWIVEKLLRKAWFYWKARDSAPHWNMQYAFTGHLVVLCNERTASDGEAFCEAIKRLKLGTVIGRRTWGGEIWLSFNNLLVDKGIASAAQMGVYGPESEWLIEGHGVEPDIDVDNLPFETYQGKDRQLEYALGYLKNKIREHPVEIPEAPQFPNKTKNRK
ncbi:MAG TPA: protease [Firmicutes bacterium]|nr:protease [Bacillota bacterium]